MATATFSIGEAVRFGWHGMKSRFWFFIGLQLIVFVVSLLPGFLAGVVGIETVGSQGEPTGAGWVVQIISSLLQVFLGIGVLMVALKVVDQKKPEWKDLVSGSPVFLKFLGTSILYSVIVLVGFVLFIIPGVILSIMFQFAPYFVVDKGVGPIQALKMSAAATKGSRWNLFLFGLVTVLIGLLGLIALIVGLLVAYPVILLAATYVYRRLQSQPGATPIQTPTPQLEPQP